MYLSSVKLLSYNSIVSSANMIQEIYREAESLKKLNHKNIIALYHAFLEGKQLCMIMEYAAGGELYKYVEEKKRVIEVEARRIVQ
jgi:protein-serine/threonine kinase